MAGNYKKIVQSVAYLATKSGECGLNRLHAFKLLFLADRDHLRRCGSTITGDTYNAMKFGPLPVAAERLIKAKRAPMEEREYADHFIGQEPVGRTKSMIHALCGDFDQLAKEDIASLDTAWEAYLRCSDVVEYTHQFPEWQKAIAKMSEGESAIPMDFADFFSPAPEQVEYCTADAEWVQSSKELYDESTWIGAL